MAITAKNIFVLVVPTLVNYTNFTNRFTNKYFGTEKEFEKEWDEFVRSTGAATSEDDEETYDRKYDESGMNEDMFHYDRLHVFMERMNNEEGYNTEEDDSDGHFYTYVTIYQVD